MIVNFRDTASNPGFNIIQPVYHGGFEASARHDAEAIKNIDDITKIARYLKEENRTRDYLIFIAGINFGYRCGDLLTLKIGQMINEKGWPREQIVLNEDKTKKRRCVYMNKAVEDALMLYLNGKDIDLDDYLFPSQSTNNSKNYYKQLEQKGYIARYGTDGPLSVRSVERILKNVINIQCGIDIRVGTHTLRKTFGYHALLNSPDRNRGLELVQKLLNHSSPAITLRYIGVTEDEMKSVYQGLNLGQQASVMDTNAVLGMRIA